MQEEFREGAIAQSVQQWSRNPVTQVRNQGAALTPFGKSLILITRSLGEGLKPSALWLLTYKHLDRYPPNIIQTWFISNSIPVIYKCC